MSAALLILIIKLVSFTAGIVAFHFGRIRAGFSCMGFLLAAYYLGSLIN